MGSTMNFYDATAHAVRLYSMITDDSLAAHTQATSKALDALMRTGALHNTRQRGYNPFPAPGKAGEPVVGDGLLSPQDARSVIPYPRVRAEC
jgi:hypothetical protein